MKEKTPYGETKLRVCSGTLAMSGKPRKGNLRVALSPVPSSSRRGSGDRWHSTIFILKCLRAHS